MGASWAKADFSSTSSNASSMVSLEPSDPPHIEPFIAIVKEDPVGSPTEVQRPVGLRRPPENQKSIVTEWRRFLRSSSMSIIHPSKSSHSSRSLGQRTPANTAQTKPSRDPCVSLPMKCPPRRVDGVTGPIAVSLCHSSGSSEYLKKLYDLRTWNMYNLIMQSRRKQSVPGGVQQVHTSADDGMNEDYDEKKQYDSYDGMIPEEMSYDTSDSDLGGSYSDHNHVMLFPLDDQ